MPSRSPAAPRPASSWACGTASCPSRACSSTPNRCLRREGTACAPTGWHPRATPSTRARSTASNKPPERFSPPPPEAGMRRLTGVAKRYRRGGGPVLSGVDLDIAPGDVVALVGGNVSGKSTLARIVAGLCRPSEGTVTGTPTIGYLPDRFQGGQRFTALD